MQVAKIIPEDTSRNRRMIRLQGWTGADVDTAEQTGLAVRLAPAFCMASVALATALASPVLLLIIAGLAVVGAIAPSHPVEAIYNNGIRHLLGRPRLPEARAARRSGCAIGSVWLAATAFAFAAGFTGLGYSLGAMMSALAAAFTFTGFCIPSFMYRAIFGAERAVRPRLTTRDSQSASPAKAAA